MNVKNIDDAFISPVVINTSIISSYYTIKCGE